MAKISFSNLKNKHTQFEMPSESHTDHVSHLSDNTALPSFTHHTFEKLFKEESQIGQNSKRQIGQKRQHDNFPFNMFICSNY